MANKSRTLVVLIPVLLSLASLIVLILIFTGNTSPTTLSHNIYFIKVTTTNSAVATLLHDVSADLGINLVYDWYTIGLWNYCAGAADSTTPTFCSPRQAFFWFDPVAVWHLSGTPVTQLISSDATATMHTYQEACKWLFIAYIAAVGASAATLVVSAFAFCRRLGSAVTSLLAIAALVFTAGSAATATVLYNGLVAYFKTNLGKAGLDASLGSTMFTLVWLAVATSVLAALFFLATACCCKGRVARGEDEGEGKRAQLYERVPSPYGVPSPWAPSHQSQRSRHKEYDGMDETLLYPQEYHSKY